jgi:hypothetical protein
MGKSLEIIWMRIEQRILLCHGCDGEDGSAQAIAIGSRYHISRHRFNGRPSAEESYIVGCVENGARENPPQDRFGPCLGGFSPF